MVSSYMPLSHSMVQTRLLWLDKWQAMVLFPLSFIVYMNWSDKCSQADKCSTIGNCKISCLLFADGLILLAQNLASR